MHNLNQNDTQSDELIVFADEQDDELHFADESAADRSPAVDSWKILIVDDDAEIHNVTKLALGDFYFEEKPLKFISAFSGAEAKQVAAEHDDIAMILLDVIMETDEAGLDVVKYVRNCLHNKITRIILRTGQPGKIPEDTIIVEYDINDYKTKTELTRKKLFTKVITSLRGFSALVRIEQSKQELSNIALENAKLYEQVEIYARTLEDRVAERTQQLESKNQQLQQEIRERKRVERELQQLNQELNRLVNVDGLTRVANRRHFDNYLAQEWSRLKREQNNLALILCDVDHFKLYNDTYGHLHGDDCLRRVATEISQAVKRPADLVARYGGEEFGIILPNTEQGGAQNLAQKIQDAVRKLGIAHCASPTSEHVTISIGVAECIPSEDRSLEELIKAADNALYLAKQEGRDRIMLMS